ncbi:hypothetical protein BFP77_06630 [Maribacter sp. 4U21]|uniref:ATP-binding protein n=1 Tax=Maribacter sp. 4U21 TaxID=1889779 RepID=UPI000C155663|nr:ATP-binding protein [Maribacter sp. 4U21]PIB29336.1 hypothetical protein BFP77_06630 [Maribacter sp. 4U21]
MKSHTKSYKVSENTIDYAHVERNWEYKDLPRIFNALTDVMSQGLARCQIICDEDNIPMDYRIIEVNPAYEKHTGIRREFAIGKTFREIDPNAENSWISAYGRVALTQVPETIEGYNRYTNRYYRSTAYSSKRGEFMMLFEDITEHIKLLEANKLLKKSEKLKYDVLNNLSDGFQYCKILYNKKNEPYDFKILEVNKVYELQTKLKAKDVIGKTMAEAFPNLDASWMSTFIKVALTGEPNVSVYYNDYNNKYYEISSFCPKPGELAFFAKDITTKEQERINLEMAYKNVEESEKLKSAFLANMSHEIRTPLNAILGFSELLSDKTLKVEDHNRCLEHIKNSGNKLLTIISDILDISKLESQQQKLNYTTKNLNKLIDGLKEQFEIINQNKDIKLITYKTLGDNSSYISTDATRLEQILSNLIENAYKYAHSPSIEFGYRINQEYLEFYVTDSGKGIDPNNQKLIFERFRQINDTNEISYGSGLGIPIAAGFVKLFGGDIWLDSTLGMGSTFHFKIPYLPILKEHPTHEKYTILIAEDEEANFFLLEMWLSEFCEVLHAKNGKEAISIFLKNTSVDLILMDIKMPVLDGISATKEIRTHNNHIPIIAQSAFVMQEETAQILTAGCNEILSKPIGKQKIQEVLNKYLPEIKF